MAVATTRDANQYYFNYIYTNIYPKISNTTFPHQSTVLKISSFFQ